MSNYRTGVLNDFSIVSKAKFYILESSSFGGYKVKETLPVQINPTEFEHNHSSKFIQSRITTSKENKSILPTIEERKPGDIDIPLKFDIYDEYNVRTLNGMDALTSDISLMNEKFTILPKLIEYWGDKNAFVLFKWGLIQYFGIIGNVDCTYTAFSRWGEPLKCDARVKIQEIGINLYDKNSIQDFGASLTEIESKETKEKVKNLSLLAASKALR